MREFEAANSCGVAFVFHRVPLTIEVVQQKELEQKNPNNNKTMERRRICFKITLQWSNTWMGW